MSTFNAIGTAASGVTVYRKWLDAVSDNIANVDNVSRTSENAFQARYVVAQEAQDGNGAQVGGIAYGSAEGKISYVSPFARELIGKEIRDVVTLRDEDAEIVGIA